MFPHCFGIFSINFYKSSQTPPLEPSLKTASNWKNFRPNFDLSFEGIHHIFPKNLQKHPSLHYLLKLHQINKIFLHPPRWALLFYFPWKSFRRATLFIKRATCGPRAVCYRPLLYCVPLKGIYYWKSQNPQFWSNYRPWYMVGCRMKRQLEKYDFIPCQALFHHGNVRNSTKIGQLWKNKAPSIII